MKNFLNFRMSDWLIIIYLYTFERKVKKKEGKIMLWAITNLTGNNRVSKALAVRYSALPLSDTSSTTASSSTSGRGGSHHDIILPLDVEETVTCFCR